MSTPETGQQNIGLTYLDNRDRMGRKALDRGCIVFVFVFFVVFQEAYAVDQTFIVLMTHCSVPQRQVNASS